MSRAASRGQIALPLDWSAGGVNAVPLLTGPSNAEAVRFVQDFAHWPLPVAVLTGPAQSGRSLIGRLFARASGGQVIDGAERAAEESLFHDWNRAQDTGAPLLLIAELPPSAWGIALPDLASRLAAVPVVRIHEPDDALAGALIDALFASRGIIVAPDVAGYIVPRMERSYAALHRIVAALDTASLAQGRRIGVRLARETLLAEGLIDPDLFEREDAA